MNQVEFFVFFSCLIATTLVSIKTPPAMIINDPHDRDHSACIRITVEANAVKAEATAMSCAVGFLSVYISTATLNHASIAAECATRLVMRKSEVDKESSADLAIMVGRLDGRYTCDPIG